MAALGLGLAGGASLLGSIILGACGQEQREKAARLRSAGVNSIAGLRHRDFGSGAGALVAVRGRVTAHKPVLCELDREAAYVQIKEELILEDRVAVEEGVESVLSSLQPEVIKSSHQVDKFVQQASTVRQADSSNPPRFRWVRRSEQLRDEEEERPWALADGSGAELPVVGGIQEAGHLLRRNTRLIPSNEKGRDRQAADALGSRVLGVRKTERLLEVGTVMTAVGDVEATVDDPVAFPHAVRSNSHMLVLRPTLISRKPLGELIAEAESTAQDCEDTSKVLTWIGGGLLVGAGVAYVVGMK